jgi:hypothetical protein
MDIMTSITAASKAYEGLKQLREAQKAYDEATYKLKIAELANDVLDLRETLIFARDELRSKDEEIARLRASFKTHSDTVERHGYRDRKGADGEPKGHAYCPVCIQKVGMLFVTSSLYEHKRGEVQRCPNCRAELDAPIFSSD